MYRNFLYLLMAVPLLAFGQELPIEIEADSAELTETTGVSYYRGDVRVTRGKLRMYGDLLMLKRDPETALVTARITGNPARVIQPTDTPGEVVNARAQSIDYNSREEVIYLQGNAEVVRGLDRIQGERIRYDARSRRVIADSGAEGQTGRVKIVIDPQEFEQGR